MIVGWSRAGGGLGVLGKPVRKPLLFLTFNRFKFLFHFPNTKEHVIL